MFDGTSRVFKHLVFSRRNTTQERKSLEKRNVIYGEQQRSPRAMHEMWRFSCE